MFLYKSKILFAMFVLYIFVVHSILFGQDENIIERSLITQEQKQEYQEDIEDVEELKEPLYNKDLVIETKNNVSKDEIIEADEYLNNAIYSCSQNNYNDVGVNYHKFLEKLNSLDLKPGEIEYLLIDCENILKKIKHINGFDTNKNHINRDSAFEISMEYDEEILNKWIKFYTTGKAAKSIRLALERSGKYKDLISSTLEEFNLPQELQYLPIIESLFNNNTISRAKAVGMWQIMAHRGQALGLQINYWVDERKDPVKATRAAAKYLKELFILLNDWHLALSAYNRGEYGIIRDMKYSNSASLLDMKQRNATPKETQNYIPQFIVAVKIANNPEEYGFTNLNYQDPLEYDTVIINKVIDLKVIAKCVGVTVEVIKELNPSILAWCTPHGYKNFELHLPYGTKEIFLENISKEKELNPNPGFIKYKIKKGDCLENIAKKFKTTIKSIKEDNPKLKKQKYLQPKQILIIRPGRKYYK